mmetsp:Transcript_29631/g.43487  ORF Transcript_29631/g.43487 Transcript_29631/m.43487 type:complete len:95 (-) Transcript_29631:333-617(-)
MVERSHYMTSVSRLKANHIATSIKDKDNRLPILSWLLMVEIWVKLFAGYLRLLVMIVNSLIYTNILGLAASYIPGKKKALAQNDFSKIKLSGPY